MAGHGHGHSHGCCAHGDEGPGADLASEYSLYLKINLEQVQCLNEEQEGSGKLVFKPWNERLDTEKVTFPFAFVMRFETRSFPSVI